MSASAPDLLFDAAGLRLTRPEPQIARLEMDNPPANALGAAQRRDLTEALDRVDRDLEIRALILSGRGRVFCAGDDLREAQARKDAQVGDLAAFGVLFDRVERTRPPVIAAINGPCTGGGLELALSCDLRLASTAARFVCSGVKIGLIASVHRLPRLIGLSRAKAMLLTGDSVDAETAERFGLVASVHAPEALEAAALALARRIAGRAPLAVEAAKAGAAQAFEADSVAARAAYEQALADLARTEDHRAALAAFLARAEPTFHRR
jgi:enoyl-CoA hydratase/carnithine racemase